MVHDRPDGRHGAAIAGRAHAPNGRGADGELQEPREDKRPRDPTLRGSRGGNHAEGGRLCARRPLRRLGRYTPHARESPGARHRYDADMKLLLEILISAFLHPLAYLLPPVSARGRDHIGGGQKLLWAIICIVWGVGPILYILLGDGALW